MDAIVDHVKKVVESDEYTRLAGPHQMTRDHLAQCADPKALVERGTAVFAVAYSRGMIYNPEEETEKEGWAVLYLTPEGDQVVEQWVSIRQDPPRAYIVSEDDLEPAGENARRFADALAAHEECPDDDTDEGVSA